MRKLRQAQDETFAGSNGQVIKASKMNGKEFRVLPDVRNELDGLYFVRIETWWANQKPCVSNTTFGSDVDIVQEEIDYAIKWASEHPTEKLSLSLSKLLDKKNKPRKQITNLMCTLIFNDYERLTDAKVVGVKIIEGPNAFMSKVNELAMSKNAMNGTENGIFDIDKGYNLVASVTGEGMTTAYSAILNANSRDITIDPEWYSEKKVPSLMEYVNKKKKSDEWAQKWIRHYLYGEAEPTDEDNMVEEVEETPAPAPTRMAKPAPAPVKKEVAPLAPSLRESAPSRGFAQNATTPRPAGSRPASKGIASALESMNDGEDPESEY